MDASTIEHEFRTKVSDGIRVRAEGLDRFRVLTPFILDDGDHLAIVLRRHGQGWTLSDEGHTLMRLTYAMPEQSLYAGTRQKVIANALEMFGVQDQQGELLLQVPDEDFGDSLYSLVQALLRVSDVSLLTQDRVRSTFIDDFREFLIETVPEQRRTFEWTDPEHDPEGKYPVDCRINGMQRPLFVYALATDDKVRDANIALQQFEKWQLSFKSLAIFEDQEQIGRRVLSRFSDVVDRQFSSLTGSRDRIRVFLEDALSGSAG